MERTNPLPPPKATYKQALVSDPRNTFPSGEDQKVDSYTSPYTHHYPDSSSMSDDDDIQDLLASYLKVMTTFYHMYFIGKILDETISLKFIIAKCTF